jgi:hypothetical protein
MVIWGNAGFADIDCVDCLENYKSPEIIIGYLPVAPCVLRKG